MSSHSDDLDVTHIAVSQNASPSAELYFLFHTVFGTARTWGECL